MHDVEWFSPEEADVERVLAEMEIDRLRAEVEAWRAKAARLREMCDRADGLDPFDQDAYNLGTVDVRAVLDS